MGSTIGARVQAAVVVVLAVLVGAPAVEADAAPPRPGGALEAHRARSALLSAHQTLAEAGRLPSVLRAPAAGQATTLTELLALKRGRSRFAGRAGHPGAPGGTDVGLGVRAERDENEPTVSADPRSRGDLVAGSHSYDPTTQINDCVAYTSRDGGATWSPPVEMPLLTPESYCSDPVVAHSADGRVHYAYMDVKVAETVVGDPEDPDAITVTSELDVLVSTSSDGGRTWSRPTVALDGDRWTVTFDPETGEEREVEPGFDFDKPWIATHVAGRGGRSAKRNVYVSATRFDVHAPDSACRIVVTRSGDRGSSWSSPQELDRSDPACAESFVQGSRPSGGLGRDVVVAWFHSGDDGSFQGSFEIRTATSLNGGRSFGAAETAVADGFEVPFYLGPFAFHHRWFGSMFPDVEIAADGRGHLVYTHDPEENGLTVTDPETGEELVLPDVSTTAEDGDIRYARSRPRAYGAGAWSLPVTINDDGLERAQGYPALETSRARRGETRVHAIWEDHRLSPEVPVTDPMDPAQFQQSSNRFYDMFGVTGDAEQGWSPNHRVTDRSSISDFVFIGDYNDVTTARRGLVFGVWTDRRDQTSTGASLDDEGEVVVDEAALEDDVLGARLWGGQP